MMACWYCDRTDQQLQPCCVKHPGKLVCADVEGCRDFLLAQVRKHDDALAEPRDEAAEADHDRRPAEATRPLNQGSPAEIRMRIQPLAGFEVYRSGAGLALRHEACGKRVDSFPRLALDLLTLVALGHKCPGGGQDA